MKRTGCCLLLGALLLGLPALGQEPLIDGRVDVLYGDPIVIQDTQTGYGDAGDPSRPDARKGRPDIAYGSELDQVFAAVKNGTLYMLFAGNLESNGNRLNVFFDSVPGQGQNQLRPENPDKGTLLRMSGVGGDPNLPGLKFEFGFEADYFVTASLFEDRFDPNDQATAYVDYVRLYVDENDPGEGWYLGSTLTTCDDDNGNLAFAEPNAPAGVRLTIDNRNIAGVMGGFGIDDGGGVMTGIELAIPLELLGNPAGTIAVTAFIASGDSAGVSNQILGPIFAFFDGNLAGGRQDPNGVPIDLVTDSRLLDLSAGEIFPHEPFTVVIAEAARGACCLGATCEVLDQADCIGQGGTYQGDNAPCYGDYPCDGSVVGKCCFDDGLSGTCEMLTEAECTAAGGMGWDAGATCEGCPCLIPPSGACCFETSCADNTLEADCIAGGGEWQGPYTICDDNPCQFGIADPHLVGAFNGWDAINAVPMTETAPDSGVWEYLITGVDPNSAQEFKITNGLDWSDPNFVGFPAANSWGFASPAGELLVTYDTNVVEDDWLPKIFRLPMPAYADPGTWTFTGDFLQALGGSNWNNADPAGMMVDQGNHVYLFETDQLPPGDYQSKPVVTGSWRSLSLDGRSVNTSNWPFTIANAGDTLRVYVDPVGGRARLEVVAVPTGCPGDYDCDGDIDFFDIDLLLAALGGEQAWATKYQQKFGTAPPCDYLANCDADQNGSVDFFDIDAFLDLLGTDCP